MFHKITKKNRLNRAHVENTHHDPHNGEADDEGNVY